MLDIRMLHHVSLPVSDIDKAKQFYGEVLGLQENPNRPAFKFKGAWYHVGQGSLHLIVPQLDERPTLRSGKAIDSHDAHFAIRVASFSGAVAYLESKGYRRTDERNAQPSAANPLPMRVSAAGDAGFPQIYILDPDRNVIEINAESED
jgi:glyoxylase I family protein